MNTLEDLPNEIFLLIYQYLSPVDVLFSFHNLNARLSQTISGYYRHIVLVNISFQRFQYVCQSIIPHMGVHISSLAITYLGAKALQEIFTSYAGQTMSNMFPYLTNLKLLSFIIKPLISFLDYVENLPMLLELFIGCSNTLSDDQNVLQTLLCRIFTANNNKLNSIGLDSYSVPFALVIQNQDVSFKNIEKLQIRLKSINDLHQLLTILPELYHLHAHIHEEFFELEVDDENHLSIMSHLKYFHLESIYHSWEFLELSSIIKRMLYVEELSITIESYHDSSLLNGEIVFSLLSPLSIRKFNYFVQLRDQTIVADPKTILSTWHRFQQDFMCIKSDDNTSVALHTLPFHFSYVNVPISLGKNETFIENCTPQLKHLYLYGISSQMMDTFLALKKSYQVRNLSLRVSRNSVESIFKPIQITTLPYLHTLSMWNVPVFNVDCVQKLIEISSNLRCLKINYEVLYSLFDNNSLCALLSQHITCLYISVSVLTDFESLISHMDHLASTLSVLRQLWLFLPTIYRSCEQLILAVISRLSSWNDLILFGIVNAKLPDKILSTNIQQWVMNNSTLSDPNSFSVDYTEETFRLWL